MTNMALSESINRIADGDYTIFHVRYIYRCILWSGDSSEVSDRAEQLIDKISKSGGDWCESGRWVCELLELIYDCDSVYEKLSQEARENLRLVLGFI